MPSGRSTLQIRSGWSAWGGLQGVDQIKERMMSKKSQVVSGFGFAMQLGAMMDEIRRTLGVSEEEFHVLGTPEGRPHLEKMIAGLKAPAIEPKAYLVHAVEVDYGLSLKQMIEAGRYGYVNDAITPDRFLIEGGGKQTIEIVLSHFGEAIDSQEAIDRMDKEGYRPATIAELLALGAQYPDLQQKFPVVALGSCAEVLGVRRVPDLDGWSGRRGLSLGWFGSRWHDSCCFASVRKN